MDDDLIVYEPFRVANTSGESEIRFVKVVNHFFNRALTEADQEMAGAGNGTQPKPLRALEDVCGYKALFMPGATPCFILKSSISIPHVIGLRGKAVHGLSSFNIPACERGFAYIDADVSWPDPSV
jgi:cleavage and polyadenylation specificity factor subunit 1